MFPAGEIYGGTRSAWDYGRSGWSSRRTSSSSGGGRWSPGRDDIVGLDSSVILPRQVWVASGHVGVFSDPLTECLSCHKRFRADHLQEEYEHRKGRAADAAWTRSPAPTAAPAASGPSRATST